MIWQGIMNGLVAGWIYILIALGLTLVFSIMNIVQFAHGEIYMLGAYGTYYFSVVYGLDYWVAVLVSVILVGILGMVLERFLFRPFRGQFELSILIAVGLMLFLQSAATIWFDPYPKSMPIIFPGVLKIWGAVVSWDRMLAVVVGIVLVLALLLIIQRTKMGQAMVAVSQDEYAAALQGINANRISAIAMITGCALAAVAGALMGAVFSITPSMGGIAITKGIAVIVLGGLGSIPGAIIGGLILGLIDGLVSVVSNTTVATVAGFVLIIIVLLVRPRGLFGRD
jgi:branched-chain amino acid transport system permease protein